MIEARNRALAWLATAGRTLRAIVGAPDYDRYLAHMREHHAGVAPMGRGEYVHAALEARHGRPGARCC